MKVSEKLTNLRRENNLTQAELAEKMKVSRQAISRWEVGAAVPSIENLMECVGKEVLHSGEAA